MKTLNEVLNQVEALSCDLVVPDELSGIVESLWLGGFRPCADDAFSSFSLLIASLRDRSPAISTLVRISENDLDALDALGGGVSTVHEETVSRILLLIEQQQAEEERKKLYASPQVATPEPTGSDQGEIAVSLTEYRDMQAKLAAYDDLRKAPSPRAQVRRILKTRAAGKDVRIPPEPKIGGLAAKVLALTTKRKMSDEEV